MFSRAAPTFPFSGVSCHLEPGSHAWKHNSAFGPLPSSFAASETWRWENADGPFWLAQNPFSSAFVFLRVPCKLFLLVALFAFSSDFIFPLEKAGTRLNLAKRKKIHPKTSCFLEASPLCLSLFRHRAEWFCLIRTIFLVSSRCSLVKS